MESQEADKNPVVQRLRQWDAEAVSEVIEFRGKTTVVVPRAHLNRACAYLASEPFLYFAFLSDITTVDRFPIRSEVIEFRGKTTVVVPRAHLNRACAYLASEPFLYFAFLSDITTVDRFPI